MKFLIAGCGSIGRRHAANLKSLGAGEILAFDVAPESLAFMRETFGARTYGSLEEALAQGPDAVLVCNPTSMHVETALKAVEAGAHVFIEKPISHRLDRNLKALLAKAKARKLRVAVGYNLRFDKGLGLARDLVAKGRIGKVLSASIHFGQYLPDWRPAQDYRKSYSAKAEGGGIILDASHEIDYARWLLGDVSEVTCLAGKVSSLEVETEDLAEILLKFRSGAVAAVHLDFIRRDYWRGCELIGETGTIVWDYKKSVNVYDSAARKWQTFDVREEPNDAYVEEMRDFISAVSGKEPLRVTADDGVKALEIALAAKKSSETGRTVRLAVK